MRLIDADFVNYAAEREFAEEDAAKIRWLISHIPAEDTEPVRHGRWIDDMYFDEPVTRCTACKYGFAKGHEAERFRYCPHCGAKMMRR